MASTPVEWPQNSTRPTWPVTCQNGVGVNASAQDLTGNTSIVLTMTSTASQPPSYVQLGAAATVTNATAGQMSVKFTASDLAVPGTFQIVITVTYAGGDKWVSQPVPFTILETS